MLSKDNESWKCTKKVGSLIGDKEDVERRKKLASAAFNRMTTLWIRGDKIKNATKLKLYTSLIKSILLYNCGTWALTQKEEQKLDSFHRKQLKRVLNIYYPTKISNKKLYKKCDERPLSIQILESRWQLFGHILRRDEHIPANKAMIAFFTPSGQTKYKGRPPTTIYTKLNQDLKKLESGKELKTMKDLEALRSLAEDREAWKELTRRIREAAEASHSDEWEARRP